MRLFHPDTAQINCTPTEKSTQQQQCTIGNITLTQVMEYLFIGTWITTR